MFDAEQTVCIIFNGEIYNYKELRQELKNYGHCFRTNSDTEVIIHGYKEWGTDVLNHLNGMFGVAIWDLQRKRLVVARDAMGIKLVYYRIADGRFTFGSEIRAVLAGEQSQPEIDPTALNLFCGPLHAFADAVPRYPKTCAGHDAGS
jgi:asparagine synthase (glutamine-hydrolysing)